jgi:glutamate N-acetyltransferase / amino-acid N-acetyltransferase
MSLPLGFKYATTYAGIRKTEKDDVAIVVSDRPASAAAVFTQNVVVAAPVKLARKHLAESKGVARAFLVNAGNANCATRTGDKVAVATSRALANTLNVPVSHVLPASTGVIGVELDPDKIIDAVPRLVDGLSEGNFDEVSSCILTTDLVAKVAYAAIKTREGTVSIAGCTKGSGMIHPNMATTLGFVMTDAAVTPAQLKKSLRAGIATSYNRITVDGDTSTNDMVAVLANGASAVKFGPKDLARFEEALKEVLESLAKQIARDGEGAKKLVTVEVSGAKTEAEADRIGRAISNSPLVKTAVAGADPNWGRIICAAGYAGVKFDPTKVDILFQGQPVCKAGLAVDFDEAALIEKLKESEVRIQFRLKGGGKGSARFWTCDFTEGYIEINGSYRT